MNKKNELSYEKAEEMALKLLKSRQTVRKLNEKLRRKGFDRETAELVCEKMKQLGYLNDADYAEAFVHDCTFIRRYGPRKIRQALFQRGICSSDAKSALEQLDEEIHLENLRFLLIKATDGTDTLTEYEAGRFYRRMISRGFLHGQIEAVLAEITVTQENYE